ncbi:alpha/beta hydrolase [Paraburkholderia sp. Tr-20389]|uniref:alpha/beta fold hydrolase n=1 Tax=Paraburkholderia sp. Tr-20389 TaxID=2703903 RepID=UPI00197DC38B|nr:alpha/beta hydrolase [Paraburkholderia sp. Tr-20389]MBN3754763.1 alpha/beta hydrolase [Paraburkholderia sp. Tr-20389]
MSILYPVSEKLSLTAALEPRKRTILCIPGTLISPRIFEAYAGPKGFQLAAVSWMTESGPWDIEGVASKILALIDRLELPEVFLVGHSAGGAICLSVALRRKLAGLVLSNTGANTATHGDPNYPQRILVSWDETMRRAQIRRCFVRMPPTESLQMLDEYADRCPRDGVFAAATSLRRLDFAPSLAQIDCPVLLAFGRLDPVRTERDVEALRSGIAEASIAMLDAGHTPMMEASHDWNSAVNSWISSIDSLKHRPC